jgi:hypothetical protein
MRVAILLIAAALPMLAQESANCVARVDSSDHASLDCVGGVGVARSDAHGWWWCCSGRTVKAPDGPGLSSGEPQVKCVTVKLKSGKKYKICWTEDDDVEEITFK